MLYNIIGIIGDTHYANGGELLVITFRTEIHRDDLLHFESDLLNRLRLREPALKNALQHIFIQSEGCPSCILIIHLHVC